MRLLSFSVWLALIYGHCKQTQRGKQKKKSMKENHVEIRILEGVFDGNNSINKNNLKRTSTQIE